jgi:hypothetical protein
MPIGVGDASCIQFAEVPSNRRVICGRMSKRRPSQLAPQVRRRRPPVTNLIQNALIVRRLTRDRDKRMVLGRTPHKRRPADVDLLNRLFDRHAALGNRLLKRIKIYDHQLKRHNALLRNRRHIVRTIATAKNAAVDFWMQRLDAPVHHLRKAGVRRNLAHRDAGLLQMPSCPSARVEFHPGHC